MNIVLIGMSGAGKSTLGVLLAKAMGKSFTDTDLAIQQREGRLLQEILDRDGVEKFMAIEERTVCELQLCDCVIATGGSVIYSEKAMRTLQRNGRIVYLHVSFEEIGRRLTDISTRGIVFRTGNSLHDVYEERVPLYRKYGEIVLDCEGKSLEQCAGELIRRLHTGN